MPVVLLSAFDDEPLIRAGLQAGAAAYITKDADREVILSAVRAAAGPHAPHAADRATASAASGNQIEVSGSSARTRVPCPGALSISNRPPRLSTRSTLEASPMCPWATASARRARSKPRPSS